MYLQNVHYFIEFIVSVHEHRGWYEELALNIPQLFIFFFFLNPVFAHIFFILAGQYSTEHVLHCRMREKYNF